MAYRHIDGVAEILDCVHESEEGSMAEQVRPMAPQSPGGPQLRRMAEQQVTARELVEAVGQLLREAILHDETSEPWWGDRLRSFSEAAMGLRDAGVLTDDQVLELLSLFLSHVGEAEVSRITSDLLDSSLETVRRHLGVRAALA